MLRKCRADRSKQKMFLALEKLDFEQTLS